MTATSGFATLKERNDMKYIYKRADAKSAHAKYGVYKCKFASNDTYCLGYYRTVDEAKKAHPDAKVA